MSEVLKRCPFCGGLGVLLNGPDEHAKDGTSYWVQCLLKPETASESIDNWNRTGLLYPWGGCLTGTTRFDTEEEARAAWNRRADA